MVNLKTVLVGILALALPLAGYSSPRVPQHYRITCPYDDFLNEEIEFEIHAYSQEIVQIEGQFSGPTLDYNFHVTADQFSAQVGPTGGLTQLSFEGLDQTGVPLGFRFEFLKPYESGIGTARSEIIGNRVFICSQVLATSTVRERVVR